MNNKEELIIATFGLVDLEFDKSEFTITPTPIYSVKLYNVITEKVTILSHGPKMEAITTAVDRVEHLLKYLTSIKRKCEDQLNIRLSEYASAQSAKTQLLKAKLTPQKSSTPSGKKTSPRKRTTRAKFFPNTAWS